MKTNRHAGNIVMVVFACFFLGHWAMGQTLSAEHDELQDLAHAASAPDREVWWPALEELGALAWRDTALRDEIWRRARVNTLGLKFVRVEPGTFTMGPDTHRIFDVQKAHKVKITHAFYIAVTEVTNAQFIKLFSQYQPDTKYSPDLDSPAVRISWDEAIKFCEILSQREGATYRLPTEAEWEYACRGGAETRYGFGESSSGMSEHGWCMGNSTRAAPVGQLQPNDWGIYDMHGNVFEWVQDYFSHEYYASCAERGTIEDPLGPKSGKTHVLRGGGWQVQNNPSACTCTARIPMPFLNKKPFTPGVGLRETVGFRIVREVSQPEQ